MPIPLAHDWDFSLKLRCGVRVPVQYIVIVDEAEHIENSFKEDVGEGKWGGRRKVVVGVGDWSGTTWKLLGSALLCSVCAVDSNAAVRG